MAVATYDSRERALRWQAGALMLSPAQGAIMQAVAEVRGRVVSYDALLGRLWPLGIDDGRGCRVTLRTHVCKLRDALRRAAAPVAIQNVSALGYVCHEPVDLAADGPLVFAGAARAALLRLLRSHPDDEAVFDLLEKVGA